MTGPIPTPQGNTRRRGYTLFIVGLLVGAIVAGSVIYIVVKANEPSTYWSFVWGAGEISFDAHNYTSQAFTVTRRIGFAWSAEPSRVQNAVANATVYTKDGTFVTTIGNIRPGWDSEVTEIYKGSGTFYITVTVSGLPPKSNLTDLWTFFVSDQLYRP